MEQLLDRPVNQDQRVRHDVAHGDRTCAELQSQIHHARELIDQSRRLFRAACAEPRSFRRED